MGKFNAAKMSGAGDVAFQNNYNYLIDLLDNGYLAEGIVGGKRVRVDVNPRDGFRMNIDNTDVFYIDSTGDAVFTGKVTIGSGTDYESGYDPATKRRVFTETPTTPYDIGDLWSGGSTGDLKYCSIARASGSYVAGDWTLATKYTDNTVANAKNTVFNQASQPTATKEGDIWVDTDANNKVYVWSGAAWIDALGIMAYEDAVEVSKLGTTVIDGGYIKTGLVDAGRIDTGTLNAARIAASSITAEKLLVGSGNLITDVDSFEQFAVGAFGGAQIVSTTNIVTESAAYHGKKSVALQTVTAETLYDLWFNPNGTDAGFIKLPFTGRYLLSGYVKSESGYSQTCVIEPILRAGATSTPSTSGTCTAASLSMTYEMGWRRITATIDLTSVADNPYLTFRVMVESLGANQWTYWDCFQLEYIGTRVDANSSVFSPGGSTTINGNNITTGKIQSPDAKTYFDLDNDEIMMDGGVNGKIVMNPTDGFKLLNSSDDIIGGLAVVGGQIASIAQIMANSESATNWAKIGTITYESEEYAGVGLHTSEGGNVASAIIAAREYAVGRSLVIAPSSSESMAVIYASESDSFGSGNISLWIANPTAEKEAKLELNDQNSFLRHTTSTATATVLLMAGSYAELQYNDNAVGVDATGVYKQIGATKTYL